MREIKFRAWDTARGKMRGPFDLVYAHEELTDGPEGAPYPRHGMIVDQFTGLHDKNGREIYEGDVFRRNCCGAISVIEYSGDGFHANIKLIGSEKERGSRIWHNAFCGMGIWWHGEVIGNVHENSELLERREQP